MRAVSSPTPEQVYDLTAAVYDQLTADHDYELWFGHMLPVLEGHGLRKGRMLDIACGTGASFLPMIDRGWRVVGVDISTEMLSCARAKVSDRVALHRADMRQLPVLGAFELVWCLDDALNYLDTAEELTSTLISIRRNLGPEGLGAFDVNTATGYRKLWSSSSAVAGPTELHWHGTVTVDFAEGQVAEACLCIVDEGGEEREVVHRERHFPAPVVRDAVVAAGLELLGVYGITTAAVFEQPLDEAVHTKAIYIVKGKERG